MEIPGKCTSEEIRLTLTSSFMMGNHCFILLIIISSVFLTVFAIRKLWKNNIFPNCTRTLLFSAIINGVVHHWSIAGIRVSSWFLDLKEWAITT